MALYILIEYTIIILLVFIAIIQSNDDVQSMRKEIQDLKALLKSNNELYHNNSVDLLAALAFKYGTDKSKDDHKYVDFYESLFQARRKHIQNLTEIGVSAGQSLQMWYDYFPNTEIHGIDILIDEKVRLNLNNKNRIHLYQGDGTNENEVNKMGFMPNTMDLIIEDGPHTLESQERFLSIFWKYVKPNGLYIIEDVDAQRGGFDFKEHPEKLQEFTKQVFYHNHVYFVDAHVGHRNWDHWLNSVSSDWAKDHHY